MSKTISNVLLVEDEISDADVATTAFARCGVAITQLDFQTAMETLSALLLTPPDLVIFGMSRLSNAEFIFRLRQMSKTVIPIIVLVDSIYLKSFVESKCHARCACAWRPFSFGKRVFTLPQLGLGIQDSMLIDPSLTSAPNPVRI